MKGEKSNKHGMYENLVQRQREIEAKDSDSRHLDVLENVIYQGDNCFYPGN